jgi:hypothetical protein
MTDQEANEDVRFHLPFQLRIDLGESPQSTAAVLHQSRQSVEAA